MIQSRRFNLSDRNLWLNVGSAAVIFLLNVFAYWPVLTYGFFWEDPFDIGQVAPYSYLQLLTVPNSNSYYRPLTLLLLKALKLGQPIFKPGAYHLFVVSGHILSAVLLFGLVYFLYESRWYGLAAALIYSLYPVSFEAVARAISPHTWLSAATFASLWLYAWGRLSDRRWPALAALGIMSVAQLTHENGILFPILVLVLELWLVWQKRLAQFRPLVLLYFVPSILFILVWVSIPKPSGLPVNLGLRSTEALYLSQGLSFPIAGLISQLGGFGLSVGWQAGLALLIVLAILVYVNWGQQAIRLPLALAWWMGASSLAWVTRSMPYLSVSPRLLYFGSFGAAMAWASVIYLGVGRLRSPLARRGAGAAALAVILLLEGVPLAGSLALYRAGSRLMDEILAAGALSGQGSRVLFVNVPDRFEYQAPAYPLGYWGMLLAPVSQDLGDFVNFATGIHIQTRSLSDLPLLAGPVAASPYRVATRGSDAHASEQLYEAARWADVTLLTQYAPDGRLGLAEAGKITASLPGQKYLADYGGVARLVTASAHVTAGGAVQVVLEWQAVTSAQPNDTVFIHVYHEGDLIAQADGDSLAGLVPLSAWRAGDTIRDVRMIVTSAGLPPGVYSVMAGLYNRVSGQRYPALLANGAGAPDGSVLATTVTVPPP